MFEKIGAWSELLRLSPNVRGLKQEARNFYKGLLINVLRKEGLFDFLSQPRSIDDISVHFGYTDTKFLQNILDLFRDDRILEMDKSGRYRIVAPVPEQPLKRIRIFDRTMEQIAYDSAAAFPDRLRGRYLTFAGGINLFNWDNALALELYERLRRAAFRFAGALRLRGSLLDVGCGNGIGTAAIWSYYYRRGAFVPGTNMKIYGLEPDEGLLNIAREEFAYNAARTLGVNRAEIEKMRDHFPTFVRGYAENIEFDAESFDMVYVSQVLHWCNAERATKEMMRVLRPGGILFGTESFYPTIERYTDLFARLCEGAVGAIKKEDFQRWVFDAGAVSVKYATPIVAFKVVKGK